jgi:hypothetical protein
MMTAAEFIRMELTRLHQMVDRAISDLTPEHLHAVPGGHPGANTIAWGVWHHVRTEDNVVRFVLQNRRPTVWQEGSYAERLGLPPVAQGTGMSTAEAHALRIKDVPLFTEYMRRVWASTEDFMTTADAAALDRSVTVKPLGDMPAIRAVGQVVVSHGMMHVGEIGLARTLLGLPALVGA